MKSDRFAIVARQQVGFATGTSKKAKLFAMLQ